MSKPKKRKIPSFLELLKSIRVEIKFPNGEGFHRDYSQYNRKEKHTKDWE